MAPLMCPTCGAPVPMGAGDVAIWVISEDGQQLVLAGLATGDQNGGVRVWSADTGMELYRLPDKLLATVVSLAVSSDGKTLTVGYQGGARNFTVATPSAWGHG